MNLNLEENILMICKKYDMDRKIIDAMVNINFLINYNQKDGFKLIDVFLREKTSS